MCDERVTDRDERVKEETGIDAARINRISHVTYASKQTNKQRRTTLNYLEKIKSFMSLLT